MRKAALLCLIAVFFCTTGAFASTLFYGGDFDVNNPGANGVANETDGIVGGNPYGSATYQNFTNFVSWNVTGLFTNNLSMLQPDNGYWEIRSGVSEGNGGTLIASGTGAVTNTPTGRSGFGFTEYHNEVDGLNITLVPGMYWFAVVPQAPGQFERSFNSNTFGLNSIGTQTSHQQYWNSPFYNVNFTNADYWGNIATFSSGVIGTAAPEPSSVIMLGSGLIAAAGVLRRRFS